MGALRAYKPPQLEAVKLVRHHTGNSTAVCQIAFEKKLAQLFCRNMSRRHGLKFEICIMRDAGYSHDNALLERVIIIGFMRSNMVMDRVRWDGAI